MPSTLQWCRCGRFRGRNLAESVAVRRRFRAGVGVFCQTLPNGFPLLPNIGPKIDASTLTNPEPSSRPGRESIYAPATRVARRAVPACRPTTPPARWPICSSSSPGNAATSSPTAGESRSEALPASRSVSGPRGSDATPAPGHRCRFRELRPLLQAGQEAARARQSGRLRLSAKWGHRKVCTQDYGKDEKRLSRIAASIL